MRKSVIITALCAALMLPACTNKEQEQRLADAEALASATREELEAAILERDELLSLVTEISSGMDDIKTVENIVTINNTAGEIQDNKQKIANDIDAIRATLQQRRQRLAQLEAKLKNSNQNNQKLLATIDALNKQIEDQAAEINRLSSSLSEAQARIGELDQTVASLNTTVRDVTDERDAAIDEAKRQEVLANACYYAIGSKAELKEHNIIEGGGFLQKTKLNIGEFDLTFFTQADKRTLTQIPLHSKKAKILTSGYPEDSYSITKENGGQRVLHILNPEAFWAVTNYLVIQID